MADVLVRNEGSVVMLTPKSEEARAWVDENLGLESWQWLGNSFAVEWRYAPDIVDGMVGDGLEVIPECHEVTDEDRAWLSELHITASKTAAEPQVNLRQETEPDTTTQVPQQAPPPLHGPAAVALPPEPQPQQQQPPPERHTIPPELPNAALHLAADNHQSYMGYGMEDLGDSVPEFDKGTKTELSRMGIVAKLARGGWKRISMSTVQSDDNRFTITLVDPTRRREFQRFLLKDLETGESYEELTMTAAKKRALSIRGEGEEETEPDLYEEWLQVQPETPHPMLTNLDTTKTPNRTARKAAEETMATPTQGKKATSPLRETLEQAGLTFVSLKGKELRVKDEDGKIEVWFANPGHASSGIVYKDKEYEFMRSEKEASSKWARLRQVAVEEPKEAGAAIAELAEALGTMADSLTNLRTNLDLIEAPKTASIKTRIQAARKYAAKFRQLANEEPEVLADALSEVYHSLDDVAGAVEVLAENLGIELNLSPVEEQFDEEAGHIPEEPEVNEFEFEEAEEELESPEAQPDEEELDEEIEKEAGSIEFDTDRDEQGEPKTPVLAANSRRGPAAESAKKLPDFLKKKDDKGDKKKDDKKKDDKKKDDKKKRADGSAGFVTDRDFNAKPEAPSKVEIPEAEGATEVGKAAARREATRQRIAKRHGITL